MSELAASYVRCQRLARRAASNFYFSFLLLPRPKRQAMCALYAYLRRVDDLGDDEALDIATRQRRLADLRENLHDALAGSTRDPYLPALADTVARYDIPVPYLTAAIDGVTMDLAGTRYETFAELEEYCYRVASVVGLACIHIWGFHSPAALEPARRCGIAFQLTNILRDLKEDAARGRLYLPAEDLRRCGYTVAELEHGEVNQRFAALMRLEIERAEAHYAAAAELEPLLSPDGRRVFRAMAATYRRLLEKIKLRQAEVFERRIRLSWWEKLRIASAAVLTRE